MTIGEKQEPLVKQKPKPPYKEGQEWVSETINTDILYCIKQGKRTPGKRTPGKPGLYIPHTHANKSNIVKMVRFMDDETHWVNADSLEKLGGAVIYKAPKDGKMQGKTITLADAFDNLQEHLDSQPVPEIYYTHQRGIMHFICPGYDEEQFLPYHATKVMKWYNEIITAINKAS